MSKLSGIKSDRPGRKTLLNGIVNFKLVCTVSILIISGFLATSFSSYFVSLTSLRYEISLNELPLTSDNIYSEIQRDLLRPVFISSLMASDTFFRDWVMTGERDKAQISKYLSEIKSRYSTVSSFFVSENTRNYYYSEGILKTVSPDEPRDIWYFRVKTMSDDYEINVDPDMANSDTMTIFINYKVYDYNRNYIGATGVGLTVSAVKQLIEIYQNKYNRTIYFVDRNGEVKLAGSDFNPEIKNISGRGYFSRFKKNLNKKGEWSFSYKKSGTVIHTNIRYIKEFDWYLVVEQPEKETVRQIWTALIVNLIICLMITIIVLVLVTISVHAYNEKIETLRGIVPICSYCKQIRDDKGYWNKVEAYVSKYTDAQFSHSICPSCMEKHYPEEFESLKRKKEAGQEEIATDIEKKIT